MLTRLDGVETRLGRLEEMVQVVIDGGSELDSNMKTGFDDLKSELDRQQDLIVDLRRKMLQRVRPRTIFFIMLTAFFLWCILLYMMH